MSKPLWYLIHTGQKSSWVSTQKIAQNLLHAYELLSPEVEIVSLHFDRETEFDDIQEILKVVGKRSPDKIIFIDHIPHPINLIKALHRSLSFSWQGEFIFHIYGDFTLHYRFWHLSSNFLKERKVRFLAASQKQAFLLEKFLDKKLINICPFPTKAENYYFDSTKRAKSRDWLKVTDSDFLWVYTGRLSRQKNIIETIDLFSEALKENPNICFFLAGKDDNINAPYFNLHSEPGEYFWRINQKLQTLDEFTRSKIRLLGPIDEEDLLMLYNAADGFLSLSLYNDEDFGMSCVEAFFTGLKGLITDWGGYSSFWIKSSEETVSLCPVLIGEYEVSFDRGLALKYLKQFSNKVLPNSQREQTAREYVKKFSVTAAKDILIGIYKEEAKFFNGFKPLLQEVVQLSMQESYIYLEPDSHRISDLYKEIYESYARNTSKPFH